MDGGKDAPTSVPVQMLLATRIPLKWSVRHPIFQIPSWRHPLNKTASSEEHPVSYRPTAALNTSTHRSCDCLAIELQPAVLPSVWSDPHQPFTTRDIFFVIGDFANQVSPQPIHPITLTNNNPKMAELDVGRFYERLNKIHDHFLKHRWGDIVVRDSRWCPVMLVQAELVSFLGILRIITRVLRE